LEEILSRAKKVSEQAEVYRVSSRRTPVQFEANHLKQIQTKESTATALRIIKDGKIGFAYVNGPIEPDKLVAMAEDTSKFGTRAEFEFPGETSFPDVEVYDPEIENITLDDMVEQGQYFIDKVRQHTSEITCEVSVSKGSASVRIINSQGGEAQYRKSFYSLGLEGVIVQDGDMLFVGDHLSSCHPVHDFTGALKEITTQLELAKKQGTISTQSMPVIFKPHGVGSALFSPLLTAFNGKVVFNGASPLKDKLGKQVFDTRFSLWDDAMIPYCVASCPCDDEGVSGRKTPLVEQGVVSHFLYDLQTAGLAHTSSTGNGSRNGGLPAPSSNSVVIAEGDVSFDDMVHDIKTGLIIEDLMGASQGNVLNGDFSGNVLLGYKIENGEITGRVKNTMVSGNIYRILKQLAAIGKDSRWLGGYLYSPSIYCPDVSVATKEG
jgi:PmbA protein